MSWTFLAELDRNDAAVRRRVRAEQTETVDLLADLLAHLYRGLEARGQHGMPSDQEQWAATFLAHAVASMRCAFELLLDGYYSQAMGMLRNAIEDASAVAYLAHNPAEAAKLTAAHAALAMNPNQAKVPTGEYRKALQRLGDAGLALAMGKAKEFVDELHLYAHASLFAVTQAQTDERIAIAGYYAAEDLELVAYDYIAVYQFVQPAVASFVGHRVPAWSAAAKALARRCARWIAPVNRQRGLPAPPSEFLEDQ